MLSMPASWRKQQCRGKLECVCATYERHATIAWRMILVARPSWLCSTFPLTEARNEHVWTALTNNIAHTNVAAAVAAGEHLV